MASSEELQGRLMRIVEGTPWLVRALTAVRDVGVPSGYVGAGAIRDTVWAALFGRHGGPRSADVDVAYFDPEGAEQDWTEALARRAPGLRWEVTNQATVHLWQSQVLGCPVASYSSVASALSKWPETATAVAMRLLPDESFEVLAPFGLADLFDGIVRRNPATPDAGAFAERVEEKQWRARWPSLRIFET